MIIWMGFVGNISLQETRELFSNEKYVVFCKMFPFLPIHLTVANHLFLGNYASRSTEMNKPPLGRIDSRINHSLTGTYLGHLVIVNLVNSIQFPSFQ